MATTITCDRCLRPMRTGFRVSLVGGLVPESGDPCGDFCSLACVDDNVSRLRGRRPDFDAARDAAGVRQLEELAMAGAYDNADDIAAALPYSPPTDEALVP